MRFFKTGTKLPFLALFMVVLTAIMVGQSHPARADDTTAPTVAFTSPTDKAVLQALPTINGTVQDEAGGSGVDHVNVGILRDTDQAWWNGTAWTSTFATQLATLAGNTWSLTTGLPPAATVSDGPYTIIAQAYDVAGNTRQANVNITIKSDIIPPTVAITAPTTNAVFRAFPVISGTATDNVGVDHVNVGILRASDNTWWNGSSWGKFATQPASISGNTWTLSSGFPTGANLQDGVYTVIAQAFDQAGNFQQANVTIRIDNTSPPTITITTPGNTLGSATILRSLSLVAGTAADTRNGSGVSSVDLFIRRNKDAAYWTGTTWSQTPTALSTIFTGYNWSRSSSAGGSLPTGDDLQEGFYSLSATAHDFAGNSSSSAATTIQIDKTTPSTVTFTSPSNSAVLQKLPTISGTATDNTGGSGISRVDLLIFRIADNKFWTGTAWGAYTPLITNYRNGVWSRAGALPTGVNLTQGSYILTATAYDRAGNSIQVDNLVRVDTKAPRLVTISSPSSNGIVRSLADVRGTAIDDTVGVDHVLISLRRDSDGLFWSGSTWSTVPGRLTTTFDGYNWSRSAGLPTGNDLTDGSYTLTATAYDRAGNQASTSGSFRVDKTVPTVISFITPTYNATLANFGTIRGAAADNVNGSGIGKVTLALLRVSDNKWWTGTTWAAFTELPTSLSGTLWSKSTALPTGSNLTSGIYVLIAFAYDKAGNSIQVNNVVTISLPSKVGVSSATASVAASSVQLGFTAPLNPDSASDSRHYTVLVNGQVVGVASAGYDATSHTVTLSLPDGALKAGDSVTVTWSNLLDPSYGFLTGQAGPFLAQ